MIKQTLVVLGACGAQGKSVIDSVKSLPNWRVVGLTHRPDCEQAKSLQEQDNVEIRGFVPLQNQLPSLLQGADVVFASAYDWDPHLHLDNEEFELRFGSEIITSCEKAQVKHIIWSSIFNARLDKLKASASSASTTTTAATTTIGVESTKPVKAKKPIETPESFTSKHQLEDLITRSTKTSTTASLPQWTILYSGFFMENFHKFTPFEPVENQRNQYVLRALPYLHKSTELPLFNVHDMGIVVRSLLLADYRNFASMKLCLYAEKKTVAQVMETFAHFMNADAVTLERVVDNSDSIKQQYEQFNEQEERRRTSIDYNTRELIDVLHWFKHDGYKTLEQACALHNSSILSSKFNKSSNEFEQEQQRQLLLPWTSASSPNLLTTFEQWLNQHQHLFKSSSTSA